MRMTGGVALKPDLGRFGVWTFGIPKPDQAVEIERLGYGALWIGGSPAGDLNYVEPILERTETLQVATGIVNVWSAPAAEVAEAYHRVEDAYPGRFLLGIGIGHPEHTEEYRKPYDVLVEYLDALDAATVPTSRRVVAALGPKVLKLSADRSAGAHPYLTTPEHTAQARELIGNSVFLAPEHKVVLTTDTEAAHQAGRKAVDFYLNLSNYRNNWKRLGFTDNDIAKPGSDKLIDAVVAHGAPEAVAERLTEHLDSGADHVTIQVLGGWPALIPALTELAGPLGLTPKE
jgi:probable F420-dependent oxidoreductase